MIIFLALLMGLGAAKNISEGSIQIRGSNGEVGATSGVVEIYFCNDASCSWGLICDNDWDDLDASTACRQAGEHSTIARGITGATQEFKLSYGDNTIRWLAGVSCAGAEGKLTECEGGGAAGDYSCDVSETAGVECGGIDSPLHWSGILFVTIIVSCCVCAIVGIVCLCLPKTPKGSSSSSSSPTKNHSSRASAPKTTDDYVVTGASSDITLDTVARESMYKVMKKLEEEKAQELGRVHKAPDPELGESHYARSPPKRTKSMAHKRRSKKDLLKKKSAPDVHHQKTTRHRSGSADNRRSEKSEESDRKVQSAEKRHESKTRKRSKSKEAIERRPSKAAGLTTKPTAPNLGELSKKSERTASSHSSRERRRASRRK